MQKGSNDTIVVGYDGTDSSQRALARAIAEAKAAHAHLLIVTVEAMPLDPYAPMTFGTLDDGPPRLAPVTEPPELRVLTTEAMKRSEAEGVAADYLWAAGDPARTIIDAARDRGASTIVIGFHHHSLFQRLLGQDVGAAVKREADCEVLVVE